MKINVINKIALGNMAQLTSVNLSLINGNHTFERDGTRIEIYSKRKDDETSRIFSYRLGDDFREDELIQAPLNCCYFQHSAKKRKIIVSLEDELYIITNPAVVTFIGFILLSQTVKGLLS